MNGAQIVGCDYGAALRSASFMRVCQPAPVALKRSNKSLSSRICTSVLLLPDGLPRIFFICAAVTSKVSGSAAMPALMAASSASVFSRIFLPV